MGVPVRFTPLLGAHEEGGPLAHLLEIGPPHAALTLLLDAGWCPGADLDAAARREPTAGAAAQGGPDGGGSGADADGGSGSPASPATPAPATAPASLRPLLAALPRVDAVLLSHSDARHAGALPLLARHGLAAPVFAAAPVAKMGALAAYDALLSAEAVTDDFSAFHDLDDADRAFARITRLKHTQAAALPVRAAAALAAHCGGGGGIVSVTPFAAGHTVGGSVWRIAVGGEEVVYAPDTNHRKER